MSASRNPKDLKQMVASSQKDYSDMTAGLAKLSNLAADDKTENAMLRSRIEEQSQLIMILKQRADEAVAKAGALDRVQDELMNFREHTNSQLEMEFRKYRTLDGRFNDLSDNHTEMIKIKDEYKYQNEQLRKQLTKLKKENENLFSKAVVDRDNAIAELEKSNTRLKNDVSEREIKIEDLREMNDVLAENLKEAEESSSQVELRLKNEMKLLNKKMKDSEEKLKAALAKLKAYDERREGESKEAQSQAEQVTKEKADLLELAMHRGKLIQDKQNENKNLEKKIENMQKQVQRMESKFEKEAAEVNANLKVSKLNSNLKNERDKYRSLEQEFSAYKKHTNDLLKTERELNERLRMLTN